jgi:hypothetical protein
MLYYQSSAANSRIVCIIYDQLVSSLSVAADRGSGVVAAAYVVFNAGYL